MDEGVCYRATLDEVKLQERTPAFGGGGAVGSLLQVFASQVAQTGSREALLPIVSAKCLLSTRPCQGYLISPTGKLPKPKLL
eukprot:1161358-Pelagomonas_calceolata.AAC.5